jgi:hypothetical protein
MKPKADRFQPDMTTAKSRASYLFTSVVHGIPNKTSPQSPNPAIALKIRHLAQFPGLTNVERELVAYWDRRGSIPSHHWTSFVHVWRKHGGQQ